MDIRYARLINSSKIAGSKSALPEYSGFTRLLSVSSAIIALLRSFGDGTESADEIARASYTSPNIAKKSAAGSSRFLRLLFRVEFPLLSWPSIASNILGSSAAIVAATA